MSKKLKKMGYLFMIIILLPYILTVSFNGEDIMKGVSINGNTPYLTVKSDEKERKLSLEEYGIGILAREIDITYEYEVLKSQAILIRTSLYKTIQDEGSDKVHTREYWTRNQMKANWGISKYTEYYEKIRSAWSDTKGQVLLYENGLALTPYHKLSNGKTRSGKEVLGTNKYPYLKIKECKTDKESENAMTIQLIQEKNVEIQEKDKAGYVTKVKCGNDNFTGEEFRKKYHLPSSCFVLQPYENQTRVASKGIGHGLGMSQNYANVLALDGKKYDEILEYFFEGTQLEEVAEIIVQ